MLIVVLTFSVHNGGQLFKGPPSMLFCIAVVVVCVCVFEPTPPNRQCEFVRADVQMHESKVSDVLLVIGHSKSISFIFTNWSLCFHM